MRLTSRPLGEGAVEFASCPDPQSPGFAIRSLNYVVSVHAAEELEDDNLTILDLENIILTGRLIARQKDRQLHETKSIIRGSTCGDLEAETVVKVGPTGKLFIVTVYLI